jgi:transposase
VEVLARVASEELRLVDVGKMLGLSYRQAKRLWQRYREEGAEGLKHRSAGRESNRAKPKKFRERVLRLVRKKYSGEVDERFGPTLAAEHLESEDRLPVHAETLRRWMLEEGLWSRARKRRKHRRRREAQEHFGEWVQLDGRLQKQLRRGEAAVTQFGRMCARLGIRIIAANSPQAKGRVERNHGTHQDRLVKKLRRKNIGT